MPLVYTEMWRLYTLQDHSVVVTHMMAIRSGHSSFGGGGAAAPMMVDSSDSPSRIHGDEARPRLEPPPVSSSRPLIPLLLACWFYALPL